MPKIPPQTRPPLQGAADVQGFVARIENALADHDLQAAYAAYNVPITKLRGPGLGGRIRNWFLTGVIVAGPLATTAYIVWWFVDTIDSSVKRLVPVRFWPDSFLPFQLHGLGVVFAFLGLTLLGFLAANLAGRSLIRFGEATLARMPVVRSIYKSAKQIFETVFSQSGTTFRKVGLIEFPGEGKWSLVFICAPPAARIAGHLPDAEHVSVFLPCTPNPTTGFYFFLPSRDVIELQISPDDAVKLIVSCGVIQPDIQAVFAETEWPRGASKQIEPMSSQT